MQAVVTGATGYIGRHLTARLLTDGWAVTVPIRPNSDLSGLQHELELATGKNESVNVGSYHPVPIKTGYADILNAMKQHPPDVVFHLAASGSASHRSEETDSLIDANIRLGTWLLEALKECRSQNICDGVFLAAGTFWQHASGNSDYVPNSLYAACKQALEDIAVFYRDVEQVPCLILKLFDVFGPRDRRSRIIDLLIQAGRTGETLDVSTGDQIVDFVHVDDVVEALLHGAGLLRETPGRLKLSHTVPGPAPRPLREAAGILARQMKKELPVNWGARPKRTVDIMNPWHGDPLPGWKAQVDFESGLGTVLADN